jgi:BatD DUF11 like domain
MKWRIITIAIGLLLAAMPASRNSVAQQASVAEPIVRVTLDPPRVVVGQQTTLHIVALAPNYMTSPPELPNFQVRNAVTRQLQSVNTSEQRDGVSYAGVSFEYAIYPQEAGSYAIADQTVRIKYAAEPPTTREVEIALPHVSFEAFVPEAAAELRPFLSASRLTVEQTIKRSSDQLKAGDAVTRTVTVRSEGTPAMLLPPRQFAGIDGLKVYPAQPVLEDKTEARTDLMISTRVDSATYMLERPGDYSLPPIDIRWWNTGKGKVDVAHLDGVPLKVATNPAAAGSAAVGEAATTRLNWNSMIDFVTEHWLVLLLAGSALALLICLMPRILRFILSVSRRRRAAYLQSEAFAFSQLRRALRLRNAQTAYFAMLEWLPHVGATAPDHTMESFRVAVRDPSLNRQIDAIEGQLFASKRDTGHWSPSQLLRRIRAARRKLRPPAVRSDVSRLSQHLNPSGASVATQSWRKPAR